MRIISNSIRSYFLSLLAAVAPSAVAADLILPVTQDSNISIDVQNNRVIAKDTQKKALYKVDPSAVAHLKRAEDIRLIAYKSTTEISLFIILSHEPSRPGNMGQGYCGAGYEDYLLLVEPSKRKLVLRDKLLLQSCLNGKLIYMDSGGDDPIKALIPGDDNSFNFRWEADNDDQTRSLTVRNGHFLVTLVPSAE
jgi:hypothetical protein